MVPASAGFYDFIRAHLFMEVQGRQSSFCLHSEWAEHGTGQMQHLRGHAG